MSNNSNSSKGISFMGLLQVALIVLKLCNVINCSWWLVFIPLYIDIVIIIAAIILIAWLC